MSLPDLTLQQKLAQLIFAGFEGTTISAALRRQFTTFVPGGFVLFQPNIDTPEQVANLCGELRRLSLEHSGVPPFIAIDQEGGRVARLGPPFTGVPPMRRVGEAGDPELTRRLASGMAAELLTVGISMNFAPVLDVDSNPDNPIIGDRSFSRRPEVVAQLGCAYIEGLMDGGVAPVGKHFPGHGDTDTDSHLDLPIVTRSRAEIEGLELAPFQAACAAGLPGLMTAHVLFPALDGEAPATLSQAILSGLLRDTWGYDGLVITDDLQMQAIAKHFAEDAALRSLAAGADILLVCAGLDEAQETAALLESGVRRGVLSEQRVEESWRRLGRLKERFLLDGQAGNGALPPDDLRQRLAASGVADVVADIERRAAAGSS